MAAHFISLCRIACMLHHSTWHVMSDIICSRRSHVTKSQELTTQEQGASTASHLILLTEHLIFVASYRCRFCRLSSLSQHITCYLILCRGAAHVTTACLHPRQHTRRISSHLAHRGKVVSSASHLILTTLAQGSRQRISAH